MLALTMWSKGSFWPCFNCLANSSAKLAISPRTAYWVSTEYGLMSANVNAGAGLNSLVIEENLRKLAEIISCIYVVIRGRGDD